MSHTRERATQEEHALEHQVHLITQSIARDGFNFKPNVFEHNKYHKNGPLTTSVLLLAFQHIFEQEEHTLPGNLPEHYLRLVHEDVADTLQETPSLSRTEIALNHAYLQLEKVGLEDQYSTTFEHILDTYINTLQEHFSRETATASTEDRPIRIQEYVDTLPARLEIVHAPEKQDELIAYLWELSE
jgi:hypothetical protein